MKKPAVDLSQDINGVTVALHADEGILPEGVNLSVKEVTSDVENKVEDQIADDDTKVTKVLAYDITLLKAGRNSASEQ